MRVVIGLVLGLALASCGDGASAVADKGNPGASQGKPLAQRLDRSHAGKPAPAVRFEMRDGTTASVADFKGKPVLVNLWATWCAPCIAELPDLDEMADGNRGLVVLAISQDLAGWRAVDKFWTVGKFERLVPRLDKSGNFAQAVGAQGLPVTIRYDAAGREVWRVNGPAAWTSPAAAAVLK